MIPTGSIEITGIGLPVRPQLTGILPFGIEPPDPLSIDALTVGTTVFVPGGDSTTLLSGADSRVITYTPTLDGRTTSGQIGPYAVLMPQSDNRSIGRVVLPPDVSAFIKATPPLDGIMGLLEALLSRINAWSKDGCLIGARIMRAVYRLIGAFQAVLLDDLDQLTVDLHLYMAEYKTIIGAGARLLGGRCNEAVGYDTPLVQAKAEAAINTVLNLDTNGQVGFPDPDLAPPAALLDAIARGVLVA